MGNIECSRISTGWICFFKLKKSCFFRNSHSVHVNQNNNNKVIYRCVDLAKKWVYHNNTQNTMSAAWSWTSHRVKQSKSATNTSVHKCKSSHKIINVLHVQNNRWLYTWSPRLWSIDEPKYQVSSQAKNNNEDEKGQKIVPEGQVDAVKAQDVLWGNVGGVWYQTLWKLGGIGRSSTLDGCCVGELQHHGWVERVVQERQVLDPVQPERKVPCVKATCTKILQLIEHINLITSSQNSGFWV